MPEYPSRRNFIKVTGITTAGMMIGFNPLASTNVAAKDDRRIRNNKKYAGHVLFSNQMIGVLVYICLDLQKKHPGKNIKLEFNYDQYSNGGIIPRQLESLGITPDKITFNYDPNSNGGIIPKPINFIKILITDPKP